MDSTADVVRLRDVSPAPHLADAAARILDDCLRVASSSRVLLAHEPAFEGLAAAALAALDGRQIPCSVMRVAPERSSAPALIDEARARLALADRSILICGRGTVRELRTCFTEIDGSARRHAHLLGINDAVVRQGLRADFEAIEALGARLLSRLGPSSEIRVTSPGGTALTARPDPTCVWHNQSGILRGPGWTNLPSGELATCPASVDGVFAPDGGVCLTDGTLFDRADAARLRVHLEGGRVTRVEGPAEAARRLTEHLDGDRDGRRVGQISFGTNTDVLATIGVVAQDSKLPGFHLTLGFTAPQCTRAGWCGGLLVNLLQRRASATIDGRPVLVDGRYPDA